MEASPALPIILTRYFGRAWMELLWARDSECMKLCMNRMGEMEGFISCPFSIVKSIPLRRD